MNVRVVSADDNLHSLCRTIQESNPEPQWRLFNANADDALSPETDLYMWDFDPAVGLRSIVRENPARHLFLVDRRDLPAFQRCIGRDDVQVLLKPVTRATLAAFLGLAVCAHAERISRTTDIRAERDEILQCLIQANLKLQEFDHDRTNFLARALHDFRSPLTAIGGYCDLLLDGALGPLRNEQKDVIRRMSRSSQRLSQMASAMYELSVDRHVHVPLNRRESSIEDCIDRALTDAQEVAASKGILITTAIEPANAALFFDPAAIEQVVAQLLENACKFTTKGGAVELTAHPYFWERRRAAAFVPPAGERRRRHSRQPNAYRVDILNPGLRIPDRHLSTIFEEYSSYSGGQDRSGGGLSLAICKMNIARHDGFIWAENRESGPVISFVLPLQSSKASRHGVYASSEGNGER